jgi:hypothetical protein
VCARQYNEAASSWKEAADLVPKDRDLSVVSR